MAASRVACLLLEGSTRRLVGGSLILPEVLRHPVHIPSTLRGRPDGKIYDAHVRHALHRKRNRTSTHQNQTSLDQWSGRTHEPDNQGRDRQTLSLREPRPTRKAPHRLHQRLQLRPPPQDAERPHAFRIYLQNLDRRPKKIQAKSAPEILGTKHLERRARNSSSRSELIPIGCS